MVIMHKPFKEDRDIEKDIVGTKYGKKTFLYEPQNDINYLVKNDKSTEQTSVNDYFVKNAILQLINEVDQLRNRILKLEKEQEEYKIQNLLAQNEISRMELKNIFKLNDKTESITLEGLLSEFVDENENSLEVVQSVRYNS